MLTKCASEIPAIMPAHGTSILGLAPFFQWDSPVLGCLSTSTPLPLLPSSSESLPVSASLSPKNRARLGAYKSLQMLNYHGSPLPARKSPSVGPGVAIPGSPRADGPCST